MRTPLRHAVERWDGCAGWGAIDDHDLLQLWIVREEMAKRVRHGAGVAFFIWRCGIASSLLERCRPAAAGVDGTGVLGEFGVLGVLHAITH